MKFTQEMYNEIAQVGKINNVKDLLPYIGQEIENTPKTILDLLTITALPDRHLSQMWNSPSAYVRRNVILRFGFWGSTQADLDVVSKMVDDPDPDVQRMAKHGEREIIRTIRRLEEKRGLGGA